MQAVHPALVLGSTQSPVVLPEELEEPPELDPEPDELECPELELELEPDEDPEPLLDPPEELPDEPLELDDEELELELDAVPLLLPLPDELELAAGEALSSPLPAPPSSPKPGMP